MNKHHLRLWAVLWAGMVLCCASGCFLHGYKRLAEAPSEEKAPAETEKPVEPELGDDGIGDIYLSPGDEIRISVYKHSELEREVKIPPHGRFFYPIVGEIKASGKTVTALREDIIQGLSARSTQKITAGDELEIRVFRHPEFDTRMSVTPDGTISIPLVGDIEIEDLNPADANTLIADKLVKYLVSPHVTTNVVKPSGPEPIVNPQVSVEILRLTREKIIVLGEVNRPGVYSLDGPARLIDALTMARGVTLDAKKKTIMLVRTGDGKARADTFVVNLEKFFSGGDMSENPALKRGDIVYVPRSIIANVDRFFQHLYGIVKPVVDIERGIWLGQSIDAGPWRDRSVVVNP